MEVASAKPLPRIFAPGTRVGNDGGSMYIFRVCTHSACEAHILAHTYTRTFSCINTHTHTHTHTHTQPARLTRDWEAEGKNTEEEAVRGV